eukprot:UN28748
MDIAKSLHEEEKQLFKEPEPYEKPEKLRENLKDELITNEINNIMDVKPDCITIDNENGNIRGIIKDLLVSVKGNLDKFKRSIVLIKTSDVENRWSLVLLEDKMVYLFCPIVNDKKQVDYHIKFAQKYIAEHFSKQFEYIQYMPLNKSVDQDETKLSGDLCVQFVKLFPIGKLLYQTNLR